MADNKPSQSTVWKAVKPFFNGGLSGMGATCIIQPVDMVKVRIQIGAQGSPVSAVASCCCLFPVPELPFTPDNPKATPATLITRLSALAIDWHSAKPKQCCNNMSNKHWRQQLKQPCTGRLRLS